VNPAISEVVLILETLQTAQIQVAEPYVFGVDARHPAPVTIDLVSTAANFKSIEMHVLPPESDLKDSVEVGQRAVATHQQAALNQRANRSQHRPELIDFGWLFPRHPLSLPLCVASRHPPDLVTPQSPP
jgi:hypothetical protein